MLLRISVFLLISTCLSVDRSNFKTCDQSGFCKRHRNYHPATSPYKPLLETLKTTDSKVSVEVINTQNQAKFILEFTSLQSNTARLKINEVDSSKRYEIPLDYVLLEEPKTDSLKVLDRKNGLLRLEMPTYQMVLTAEPFRMDIVVDNTPVISVNTQALLKFEHYRAKEQAAEAVPEDQGEKQEVGGEQGAEEQPEEQEEQEEKEEEEPDMWEETFKSHKDTKPNGPMSIGLDISFPGFQYVYGIPEHAETLALKTTKNTDPYRLYNLDVFEYEVNNPMALYGSIPVLYAHNSQRTVGMFWHNAAETWVDISSNIADKGYFSKVMDLVKGSEDIPQVDTHWFSESGIIDIFFFLGPAPKDVFSQYTKLTGTTPLPPLFGISYHQSRWNYNDEQDIANIDDNFDKYDIPCDVYWLDIEHTDGKRYFTWDSHKFPDSKHMIDKVAVKGRKMVTIVDPHIKKDTNYHVYKDAKDNGHFVKDKSGNDYDGWCWPGSAAWPDFMDPKIRHWWAEQFSLDKYEGSTLDLFTWNDMNEPSVFNGPEITMHKDAVHYGGWEHRDIHNLYGLLVHRGTYEGHLLRDPNHRPFVLSRAVFAGSQRWGAVWTGDNTGEWNHLKISMPMLLSLNIAGVAFSGADVGGFFKNPDTELLTRWYQAAAYQPFFRAHAHLDTKRREPWLLEDENMKIIRNAIIARYTYLPLWYTVFREHEQTGMPVMRPLWVEFPQDEDTFNIEDEYLIGSALLVRPVTDEGATAINIYFPGKNEVWYDTDTYEVFPGDTRRNIPVTLSKIPVYQRGGQIVPRRMRWRRASYLMANDPFTLIVTLSRQGTASGELYMDEYSDLEYLQGSYVHRKFTYENSILQSSDLNPGSKFSTEAWLERIVIVGLQKQPSSITLQESGGDKVKLEFSTVKHVLTIRKPGCNINSDWSMQIL